MSLAFRLPDDSTDLAQALEAAEPQAPKLIKPLLMQAARELRAFKTPISECAEALELAASLRAGQMDSQSRHDEIARQVRLTLTDVAAKLRALA
jgi:hypothetical protein